MIRTYPQISEIIFTNYAYRINFINISNHIFRMYYDFADIPRYSDIHYRRDIYNAFILPENLVFLLSFDFKNPYVKNLTIDDILNKCHFLSELDKEYIRLQLI